MTMGISNQYAVGTNSAQLVNKTFNNETNQNYKLLNDNVSDSFTKGYKVDKAKGGKSFGEGFKFNLKNLIPIYGTYTIGKEILEQDQALKDLEAMKNGESVDVSAKPNFLKAMGKGILAKIAYGIPVVGSYLLGHRMIEQDNAIREINGEQKKSDGFFSSLLKGFGTKITHTVPFLSTYIIGKDIEEQENLVETVNDMKKDYIS